MEKIATLNRFIRRLQGFPGIDEKRNWRKKCSADENGRFRGSQAGFEFPGIDQTSDLLQGVERRRDGIMNHKAMFPLTKCLASCQSGWQKSRDAAARTQFEIGPPISLASALKEFGGPGRDRTDDLFHAMEARSQLRHRPTLRWEHQFSPTQ